jgi:hypothetical protein
LFNGWTEALGQGFARALQMRSLSIRGNPARDKRGNYRLTAVLHLKAKRLETYAVGRPPLGTII